MICFYLSRTRRLGPLVACLILSLATSTAWAADASERALAIQLFDEGDRLMQQGQYAAACAKLAESNRLDPQLGALLYLAECYEKNGQLASAWGSYRQAEEVALKRGDERAQQAGERARALEPRLSRLVFELPPGPRPAGYQLSRDDLAIAPALWDSAISVDNGRYRVAASAPGYVTWSASVEVTGEGERVLVKVPPLEREARAESGSVATATTAAAGPPGDGAGGTQRTVALIVGGLGVVGLGVAGYFTLSASSTFDDSDGECGPAGNCTSQGVTLRDDAQGEALVATVASIAGGVAVATAAVLWFTAPSDDEVGRAARAKPHLSLAVGPTGAGVQVLGGF